MAEKTNLKDIKEKEALQRRNQASFILMLK